MEAPAGDRVWDRSGWAGDEEEAETSVTGLALGGGGFG